MTRIAHHPRLFHGSHARLAVAAGAAAVIAAGGYGAVEQLASDTVAAPEAAAVPRPAAGSHAPSRSEALTEFRDSIARRYGGSQSSSRAPTGVQAAEMQARFERLYGPRR